MIVYKYMGETRRGFLDTGLIRFTQPLALNDPYECLAAFPDLSPDEQAGRIMLGALEEIDLRESDSGEVRQRKVAQIKSAYARLKEIREGNPNFFRDMADQVNGAKVNQQLGILSLSRRWNSALMWSHYTDSYKGFCVGFDRGHEFFREVINGGDLQRTGLMPVIYDTRRTIVPQRIEDAVGFNIFLTKSTDWAYEQEDRLLALLKLADSKKDQKPHPLYLFKIPFQAISEIILGHNAPEDLRVDILAAGDRLGVPVYKTQISRLTFDIDRTPIHNEILL